MSHADFAIKQACVGLRSALKCISEAILPGLGDVLLTGHCKPSRILYISHAGARRILLASGFNLHSCVG